jgi:hypothetical protein
VTPFSSSKALYSRQSALPLMGVGKEDIVMIKCWLGEICKENEVPQQACNESPKQLSATSADFFAFL